MRLSRLARHTFDVLTILVLGIVYLVALTVGTVLAAGRRKLTVALSSNRRVKRHSEEPVNRSP